ncbi:MAG: peptide-methionine (S)-S-oxide reductase MsrA [Bacteroidales bacterium]|nr:peptide-methionine (S)-S-oxide reductase MsrA [Bacteroidales bacterium]
MECKEIYFAGGCFWGVEHFFKGVTGVTSTTPGYANGRFANPTYEQVYKDDTGFAETVRLEYNPAAVSLATLCRLFFMIIDPLSLNRQGEDCGTRYRTGVYYSSEADLPVLEAAFAAEASRIGADPVTELLPLQNFYGAEDYHQDYLDKNPGGYCHLSLKTFAYLRVFEKVRMYLGSSEPNGSDVLPGESGEPDTIARMAEIAAIVHEGMKFFWTGFYRVTEVPEDAKPHLGSSLPKGEDIDRKSASDASACRPQLVLGPFQGPPACLRIGYGRGVCGTAWKEARTIVVPDVEQFPGHIACSSASKSEIVVPVFGPDGRVTAVLDIDSDRLATFDPEDAKWLELIVS